MRLRHSLAVAAAVGLLLGVGCRRDTAASARQHESPRASSGAAESATTDADADSSRGAPNGMYLVLRRGGTAAEVEPVGVDEVRMPYARRFAQPGEAEPPEVLVLTRTPAVLLELASPPEGDTAQACSVPVRLELVPSQAQALARFTGQNQGRSAAIGVGGEVVTVHKIRSAVEDGRLQVTCCSPGACGYLMQQLSGRL
jgi:hypothetical protein